MAKIYKNVSFLRFFFGRITTNLGDSLYIIGAMWLVHDLTSSTLFTGLAGFLLRSPQMIGFLAGPVVDRLDRRRVLVVTQIVQGVFVLSVPVLSAFDRLTVWVVLAVMPTLALVSRFQYPAQSALLPQIVADDQLVRANSLFKITGRSANIAFNSAGGFIIAVIGAVPLFLFNSITFAVATLFFIGLRLPHAEEDDKPEDNEGDSAEIVDQYLTDLKEGFDYLRGSLFIPIGIGAMIINFGSGVVTAVFPAFAGTLGGPEMYGLLMASVTVGNLGGSAGSWLVEDIPYGKVAIGGFSITGAALIGAVALGGGFTTPVLIAVAFLPTGAFNVLLGSLLQSSVEQDYLGRVSSTFSSLTMLTLPLGSLAGGVVGDLFGPGSGIYLMGVATFVLVAYFTLNARIRTLPCVSDLDAAQLGLGTSE